MTVDAIYQNGIIKPLTALRLRENEQIKLRIERSPDHSQEKIQHTVHLRGIWKHTLTGEKEDWVSDTIAAIRQESSQKVEQNA
jgi:predicted DNA-binding antitoxin AbrB/MazE fold protein